MVVLYIIWSLVLCLASVQSVGDALGIVANVCVSAVVRSEAASCPRNQMWNEDINFGQHVTAP